jgi:hypothetical protein
LRRGATSSPPAPASTRPKSDFGGPPGGAVLGDREAVVFGACTAHTPARDDPYLDCTQRALHAERRVDDRVRPLQHRGSRSRTVPGTHPR